MIVSLLEMVIFHSYDKLPEGNDQRHLSLMPGFPAAGCPYPRDEFG